MRELKYGHAMTYFLFFSIFLSKFFSENAETAEKNKKGRGGGGREDRVLSWVWFWCLEEKRDEDSCEDR